MLDLRDSPVAAACACGSGLTKSHCCELDLATAKRVPSEDVAPALAAIATAYQHGDREAVRTGALAVLSEAPTQPDALRALFNVLRESGKMQGAAAIVTRLTRLSPNDATLQQVAANFFLMAGALAAAQAHGRMLIRLAPEEPVAHFTMGRIFLASGNAAAAEYHLKLADSLAPPERRAAPDLLAARAHAAGALGRYDEARALYARIDSAGALTVQMLIDWANLEEAARDFDAAFALLDRGEAIGRDPRLSVLRAGLHRRIKQPEQALAALADLSGEGEGAGALLARGQVLDSLGRYDEAFACFDAYKAKLREHGGAYQDAEAKALVDELSAFFTPGRTRLLPRAARREGSPQPIFIIGFPRSGTTLVEQTLSVHPSIAAGDELPIIGSIAHRAQLLLASRGAYPKALSELWLGDRRSQIDTLRDLYLNDAAEMGAIDPAKRWFTDKMPLNETHLGLISLMFPESPILHLVRHPLDVVLSVFSNALTHGFHCAASLESAAIHYARIASLIARYRAAMPLRYHAVRYEDLVTDQEREVRAMLAFIGEPFDPATLSFHENRRHARTASYAQVTETLYTRSRYRYRNYLDQLAPVIPILEPVIARLGYTIER